MTKELLSLVRQSVAKGYLPTDWHASKNDLVKTIAGFYALADDCENIDDGYYHKELDSDWYTFDERDHRYILEDESITVYDGVNEDFVTHKMYRGSYYRYNGDYYTMQGLEAHNLVLTVEESIMSRFNAYYWESDDMYHELPEPEDWDENDRDSDDTIWGYHDGPCPPDYREDSSIAGIGFEIEKGDDPIFCGYDDKEELFNATGCVMEEDSSVDWELKTPIYPLFSERIEKEWLSKIAPAINAADHDCAGGHIHLSLPPKSGKELFDFCRPYLPLFMAMYPKRLESDYCKGKSENNLKRDGEKHQAVKVLEDRIELRFPAKVYNMTALLFRLAFCRLMLQREYKNIACATRAAFDESTELGKLVLREYDGKEAILLMRVVDVARTYFNTNLRNEKNIEALITDLKTDKLCVS